MADKLENCPKFESLPKRYHTLVINVKGILERILKKKKREQWKKNLKTFWAIFEGISEITHVG